MVICSDESREKIESGLGRPSISVSRMCHTRRVIHIRCPPGYPVSRQSRPSPGARALGNKCDDPTSGRPARVGTPRAPWHSLSSALPPQRPPACHCEEPAPDHPALPVPGIAEPEGRVRGRRSSGDVMLDGAGPIITGFGTPRQVLGHDMMLFVALAGLLRGDLRIGP